MNALVYVEQRRGTPTQDSLGLLTRAKTVGLTVFGVVCGSGVRTAAEEAVPYGAQRVFLIDDPRFEDQLPQPQVDVLAQLVRDQHIETMLFATSVLASDLAGALAARLEAGVNWDLFDFELRDGALIGRKLVLGDTALVEVGWKGGTKVGLVRAGSFEPLRGNRDADIVEYVAEIAEGSTRPKVLERWEEQGEGPSIENAEILVGVGKGIGDRETLASAEQLARELHGALAVTMPIVDRGWYSHANQVGQTGKTVQPRLFIACGISGAIQHRIGMERSGTIVAINTDPRAPIFAFSDLGVVGDVHPIIPRLTELIRARRTQ
jgi:electron transfer flavoprotein alpha subunit